MIRFAVSKKRKWRPSGRKLGPRWLISPGSIVVRGTAAPPEDETRYNPAAVIPKMITPSLFHAPPRITPGISIFFSLPPSANAIDRLSGDHNGYSALSVPRTGRAVAESS